MLAKCPKCESAIKVEKSKRDRRFECPSCGTVYSVKKTPDRKHDTDATLERTLDSPGNAQQNVSAAKTSEQDVPRLGRFEIKEKLGEGGFGIVYRAFDPHLTRSIALKVPKFSSADTDRIMRFLAEAKAAAQLRHPGIVPVHDCGKIEGRYFIASQYVSGKPLSDHVRSDSHDFRQIAGWISDVARALAYAHEQGVIHRDVKSENIMIDHQGHPQVMDFGLAKLELSDSGLTTDGCVLGTPAYMSPEQARGESKRVGPTSDQYSLGVVLYELLAKQRPFGGHPTQVISLVRNAEPLAPSKHNSKVPTDLEIICLKAMSKDPGKRYSSCDSFADDLDRWLNDEPIHARPVMAAERFFRWCRRNPRIAALSSAIAAILTISTLVLGVLAFQLDAAVDLAKAQTGFANSQTTRAEEEAERADGQAKRAIENERLANERADEAEHNLYIAKMNLGASAYRDGDANGLVLSFMHYGKLPTRGRFELGFLRRMSWQELFRLEAPGRQNSTVGHASDIAYSRDGKLIAAKAGVGILVWDSLSGKALTEIPLGRDPYRLDFQTRQPRGRLAWSPCSKRLACATNASRTIHECNAVSGEIVQTFEFTAPNQSRGLERIAYSPDGKFLAAAADGLVKIWNLADRSEESFSIQRRHRATVSDPLSAFEYCPDGTDLLLTSGSSGIFLWDIRSGHEDRPLQSEKDQAYTTACFSVDGTMIAGGSKEGSISVWEVATGRLLNRFFGHQAKIADLAFHPDNKRLFSCSDYENIRIWNLLAGKQASVIKDPYAFDIAISPDGATIVTNSGKIRNAIDQADYFDVVKKGKQSGWNPQLAFSHDGKRLISRQSDVLTVYDVDSGALLRSWQPHGGQFERVPCVVMSPDQPLLITASNYGKASLWNYETGEKLVDFLDEDNMATQFAFGPGSQIASIGQMKNEVVFWDHETGQPRLVFDHVVYRTRHELGKVSFDQSGSRLVTYKGGVTRVWDLKKREQLAEVRRNGSPVYQGLEDSGTKLVTGSVIHNASTGEMIGRINNGGQMVTDISNDYSRIACLVGRAVHLVETRSMQTVLTLPDHPDGIKCIAFNPAGDMLAVTCEDGTVRIWDGRPWTPQSKVEHQARTLLRFLKKSGNSKAEAIRLLDEKYHLTEEVRKQAHVWADLYFAPLEVDRESYKRNTMRPAKTPVRYVNDWPRPDQDGRIEGEDLFIAGYDGQVTKQDMTQYGQGVWSGNRQLFWRDGKEKSMVILGFQVDEDSLYSLGAALTTAPDYATVRVWLDRKDISGEIDLIDPSGVQPTGEINFDNHELTKGRHRLTVEIVSFKQPAANTRGFGVDYITLEKQ